MRLKVIVALFFISNLLFAQDNPLRYGGLSKYLYTPNFVILNTQGMFSGGINTHTQMIKQGLYPISYPGFNTNLWNTDLSVEYVYDIFPTSKSIRDGEVPINSIYSNGDAIFVLSKRYNQIEMALIKHDGEASALKKGILLSEANCSELNKPSDMIIIDGTMYWTNTGTNSIGKATITFDYTINLYKLSNIQYDYISGCSQPVSLAYDNVNGILYWTNFLGSSEGFGSIGRVSIASYESSSYDINLVDQEYITNCLGPVDLIYQNWDSNKSMLLWTNWLDYRIGAYTSKDEDPEKDRNKKVVFFDFGGSPYKLDVIKSFTPIEKNCQYSINIDPSMGPGSVNLSIQRSHIAWINMHQGTIGTIEKNELYDELTKAEIVDDLETFYPDYDRIKHLKCDLLYTDRTDQRLQSYKVKDIYFNSQMPLLDFVNIESAAHNEYMIRYDKDKNFPIYTRNYEDLELEAGKKDTIVGNLSYVEENTSIGNYAICSWPAISKNISLIRQNEFLRYFPQSTTFYAVLDMPFTSPQKLTLYSGFDDGDRISAPFPCSWKQTVDKTSDIDIRPMDRDFDLDISIQGEYIDPDRLFIETSDKVVQKPTVQFLGSGRVRIINNDNQFLKDGISYNAKYIKQDGDTIEVEIPIADASADHDLSNTMFFTLRESYGNSISRLSPDNLVYSKKFKETLSNPGSIETDEIEQRIFWTNGTFSISRMDYSKENFIENFLNTKDSINCFALDLKNENIYVGHNGYISIWKLDATRSLDSLIINAGNVLDIEVDTTDTGNLFWINGTTSKISKSNLDGTSINTSLINVVGGAQGLALDLKNSKIYWTRINNLSVGRANLDGSSVQTSYVYGSTGHSGDIEMSKISDDLFYKRDNFIASLKPNGTSSPTVNTTFHNVSNLYGLATASDYTNLDKISVKLFDFELANGKYFKKSDSLLFSFKVENNGEESINSSNIKFEITDNITPMYVSRTGDGTPESPFVFKYKIIITQSFQDKAYKIKIWIEDNIGNRSNTIDSNYCEFMVDSSIPQIIACNVMNTSVEQHENLQLEIIIDDGIAGYIDNQAISITSSPSLNHEFKFVAQSGNAYYFMTKTDANTFIDNYNLVVSVSDLSGNVATYNPAGFEFEITPNMTADFSFLTLDSTYIKKSSSLKIGFDVMYGGDNMFDENHIQIQTVPPLENQFVFVDKIGEGTYQNPARYLYEVPISQNDVEGKYNIILSGMDDAGNEAETYNSNAYEFYIDETQPAITNLQTDKTTYTQGEEIILSFDVQDNGSYNIVSENIGISLDRSFRNKLVLNNQNDSHFEYKLPISALDPKGNLTFDVYITDNSGNQSNASIVIQVN